MFYNAFKVFETCSVIFQCLFDVCTLWILVIDWSPENCHLNVKKCQKRFLQFFDVQMAIFVGSGANLTHFTGKSLEPDVWQGIIHWFFLLVHPCKNVPNYRCPNWRLFYSGRLFPGSVFSMLTRLCVKTTKLIRPWFCPLCLWVWWTRVARVCWFVYKRVTGVCSTDTGI